MEICTRVITLYLLQNFVSAQYLENQSVEFHQILYMHSSWQNLAWDCYLHFSEICTRVMALDLRLNFISVQYLENKWTKFHQIFIYAFILTRSTLGLLHIIFRTFVPELWPLIYAKISFPFQYFENKRTEFNKFNICICIDKIYVGIVTHHFSHIFTRVMALDLSQNFVYVQYLENKWTKLHQILYMQSY